MNYFTNVTRVAHVGATVAALVVAAGASIGFHDMTGSWGVAILSGVGIASLLALGWYVLITLGARARRVSSRAMTILLGAALVVAALGTSGWALATAIGGKQALANYQTRSLIEHEIALADAMSRVNGQADLIDLVSQHAAATELLGAEEQRSGAGPLFRSYERTKQNLLNAASAMGDKIDGAQPLYAEGIAALENASMVLGDAEAFRIAMSDAASVIMRLNAIAVHDDVLSMGMVGLNDKGLPELSTLTASLRAAAEGAAEEATTVAVPRYVPMTRSEATLTERPLGAWVAAVAIDAAPLILLLLVMLAASEPLLREERKKKERTTDEEIRSREENIIGIRDAAE